MSKKKAHEEYIFELSIKNPTVEVVGKYIDANTKIMHRCLIHDICWETTPSRALQGVGCEMCKKERFRKAKCKTHSRYVEEVSMVNPNIEVVEEYVDATTPIKHYCIKHDIYWNALPDNILHGHGCVECGKEKIGDKNRKTYEQYIEELKTLNSNIIVIGVYINALTPILHKCLIDGYEWYASPANILFGTGCPKCNESKGEKHISKWLDNNNIQYISQKTFKDCKNERCLPFDFYLPEYNLAIEYQGEQHYRPIDYFGGKENFEAQQKRDNIKRDYCKNNNINMLEIPYYKNVEEELNNFLFI